MLASWPILKFLRLVTLTHPSQRYHTTILHSSPYEGACCSRSLQVFDALPHVGDPGGLGDISKTETLESGKRSGLTGGHIQQSASQNFPQDSASGWKLSAR